MTESESVALPFGDSPSSAVKCLSQRQTVLYNMKSFSSSVFLIYFESQSGQSQCHARPTESVVFGSAMTGSYLFAVRSSGRHAHLPSSNEKRNQKRLLFRFTSGKPGGYHKLLYFSCILCKLFLPFDAAPKDADICMRLFIGPRLYRENPFQSLHPSGQVVTVKV